MALSRGIFILALLAAAQAHQMTKRHINDGGKYCAELRCFHPSPPKGSVTDGVALSDVTALTLEALNEAHSFSTVFLLNVDGKKETFEPRDGVHDFKYISDGTTFEYSVMLSNTLDCESSEVQFACYLDYLVGEEIKYNMVEAVPISGGDGGSDGGSGVVPKPVDDDVAVADAVIDVMETLANDLVRFGWNMDDGVTQLDGKVFDLEAHANRSVEDAELKITADFQGVSVKSVESATKNKEEITLAETAVDGSLAKTSSLLLGRLSDLQADVDTRLDNEQTHFIELVNDLNQTFDARVNERDTQDEKLVGNVQSQLGANLMSLVDNLADLGGDTRERLTNTTVRTEAEFSSAETNTRGSFDTIDATSSANSLDLETDFSSWVSDFTDSVKKALTKTGEAVDSNSAAISTAVEGQVNATAESVSDITARLGQLIQGRSDALVSSIDQASSDVKNRISGVQDKNTAELATLNAQVNTQAQTKNARISSVESTFATLISDSSDAYTSFDNELSTAITGSVDNVQGSLNTGRDNVGSSVGDLKTATSNDVASVKDAVTESLGDLNNQIKAKSDGVSTGLVSGIQTLGAEQLTSADEKHNKTSQNIDTAQASAVNTVLTFSSGFEQELGKFEASATSGLTNVRTEANQNMDALHAGLGKFDYDTSNKVETRTQSVSTNTQAGSDNLSKTVADLRAGTNGRIDQIAQSVEGSVSGVGAQLDLSVGDLETESLARLVSLRTDAKKQLGALKKESKGLLAQVETLGAEVNTEQDLVTALDGKFGNLTQRVGEIDAQVDDFQKELVQYSIDDRRNFESASQVLAVTSRDTIGLLDGVSGKISIMTGNVETSIVNLQGLMDELDVDIKATDTNLSTFLHSNIGDITHELRENTNTLTKYLQPRTCEKSMDYTTASNNRYVIISPNEENDIGFDILCDTATNGGGWIVLQRRSKNDAAFYKNWETYKEGFGSLESDFYIGNDRIHELTSKHKYELRVTVMYESQEYFAQYDSFSIDDEKKKYTLHVGKYSGTAGDSMTYHNGMKFSTHDQDNDRNRRTSCAVRSFGAWWYRDCHYANLNGRWGDLRWYTLTGTGSASTTEIKIRRVD